ncbi:UvrD-helicase domain-containing protein [Blattabacterium cuenoti]|uniref:UvrD-helicase domain-containing protein n=1 Tax=Blattabacterium cuenoti TaxID=1653831 RepID=UPI00163C67E7|nr:UvrD-helicase domain-containing protein [Blattabacterium cuenoti]
MLDLGILKIYNASAGSGKTSFLIKNYLYIVLTNNDPLIFKNILILTFNKKSSEDIKNNILECIKDFSKKNIRRKYNLFFNYVIDKSNLKKNDLYKRSKKVLNEIIYDFNTYIDNISTIDKFTYRIISSFLPNFSLEMNTNKFVYKIIKNITYKLKNCKTFNKYYYQFFIDIIKDGKIWNLDKDFYKITTLMINENYYPYIKELKKLSSKDFINLKYILIKRINKFEEICKIQGNKFYKFITSKNIDKKSFIYSDVPNFFRKFYMKNILINPFKNRIENNIKKKNIFSKENKKNDVFIKEINFLYNQTKFLYKKYISCYTIDKLILNNINLFSIINNINKEFLFLKNEEKILLNEEINQILYNKINKSLPKIYEKIGSQYKYYLIDEFQDISIMQWKNIEFLIENSLSENGLAIIVGDPKQSIYRWRGGDSKKLIELIYYKNSVYKKELKFLKTNFRSYMEIIKFNNLFYSSVSKKFNCPIYKNIYKNSIQKIYHKDYEGYVELNFIDSISIKKDNYRKCIYNNITKKLKDLLKQKYSLSDIAILVRTNEEGNYLSEMLIKKKINVNTSVFLLMKNCYEIKIIINFFYILSNNFSYKERIYLIFLLIDNDKINISKKYIHNFIYKTISLSVDLFIREISKIIKKKNLFTLNKLYNKSIYDISENIIDFFDLLNNKNMLYIYSFLDFVYRSIKKVGNSIIDFLKHWEYEKDKENVTINNNLKKSINIMTIHKSKGLQFPVVILPFADWNIFLNNEKIKWIKINPNLYNGLNHFYLEIKSFYKYVNNNEINNMYEQTLSNALFDNINLLYVATTRPIQQLIIFSKLENKKLSISYYMKKFLCNNGIWNNKKNKYTFGKKKNNII